MGSLTFLNLFQLTDFSVILFSRAEGQLRKLQKECNREKNRYTVLTKNEGWKWDGKGLGKGTRGAGELIRPHNI